MAQIKANVSFDAAKGTATVTLELAGTSEMEHELLAQYFTARSVSLVPFHVGDQLESRFVIEDAGAFARAQRATENRIRLRDGRPTVEAEESAKAAKAKALEAKQKADADAVAEGYDSAEDKEQKLAEAAQFDKLASAIATKLSAKPAEKPAEAPKAPEPDPSCPVQ
jgi:cell division protein YceG involved in septum cleavage